MSVKISVKSTISELKEKNAKPKHMYNKAELSRLVLAMMNDEEYITENTKIKSGEFIVEQRQLSADFKKALVDVLKAVGLKGAEAEELVKTYKIPKSLAAAVIDVVHACDFLYMNEVGKGIRFIGAGDSVQTMYMRKVGERTHRIPKKDGESSKYSGVKIGKHVKLDFKTKINPAFKALLQ